MKATPLTIPDVLLLEPRVFEDERGFFYESYNQQAFDEAVGHPVTFVQDNHSRSVKGTLRGLHYQLPPHPQGKLVRVTLGFLVTSDIAEFQYKCTDFYAPACERSIRWNDANLGIDWPLDGDPLISAKDAQAATFRNAEVFE